MAERLQKLIAASGYTSRRKAEQLILEGKVSVNGEVIKQLGVKAEPSDVIIVEGVRLLKENKKYKQITLDDVKNFKDIWDILEPIYWTIDIYNSYEKYLQSAELFTLEQRYLNAINWYFIEVNNGGHFQFLDNLTGIVWEDTLKGFRLFGMMELADNFQKVVDLFGGSIPFDNEERWNALESMDDNLEEFLEQADNFVYDYEGIFEDTYIRNHPEKFIFKQDLE